MTFPIWLMSAVHIWALSWSRQLGKERYTWIRDILMGWSKQSSVDCLPAVVLHGCLSSPLQKSLQRVYLLRWGNQNGRPLRQCRFILNHTRQISRRKRYGKISKAQASTQDNSSRGKSEQIFNWWPIWPMLLKLKPKLVYIWGNVLCRSIARDVTCPVDVKLMWLPR